MFSVPPCSPKNSDSAKVQLTNVVRFWRQVKKFEWTQKSPFTELRRLIKLQVYHFFTGARNTIISSHFRWSFLFVVLSSTNQGRGSAHDLFTSSWVIYRKYIIKVCFSWKWAYFSILFASIRIYRPSRMRQYFSLVPKLSVNWDKRWRNCTQFTSYILTYKWVLELKINIASEYNYRRSR